MTVRVGYLRAPIAASGYYFPRTSRRGPQRTRRGSFALAPNYRFLGQDGGYTPPPTAQSYLPAGSVLSYTVTWQAATPTATPTVGWNDPNAVQSAIASVLSAKWGIQILSQWHGTSDVVNFTGQSGFTLQVQTTRDYGQPNDVRSIIDGELYNLGMSALQSNIAITKTVQSPGGASLPPQPPQGVGDWLSNNWPWLAAAGVGFVAVKEFL